MQTEKHAHVQTHVHMHAYTSSGSNCHTHLFEVLWVSENATNLNQNTAKGFTFFRYYYFPKVIYSLSELTSFPFQGPIMRGGRKGRKKKVERRQ